MISGPGLFGLYKYSGIVGVNALPNSSLLGLSAEQERRVCGGGGLGGARRQGGVGEEETKGERRKEKED